MKNVIRYSFILLGLLYNISGFALNIRDEDLRPTPFSNLIDTLVILFFVTVFGIWFIGRGFKVLSHVKQTIQIKTPVARNLEILKQWIHYKSQNHKAICLHHIFVEQYDINQ